MRRSEANTQARIRLEAAKDGVMLWRNNSGALLDDNGRMIRFGLGNDSKAVNEQYKSADLIGITPVTVTQEMVGQTIGVFTSIECKRSDWLYLPGRSAREDAQYRWNEHVKTWGGRAGFATGPDEARKIYW